MNIIDISMEISSNMTVYKDKPEKKPKFDNMSNFVTASSYETLIQMPSHTGTHLDMPLHMIDAGATSETYDFMRMFGVKAKVLDLQDLDTRAITEADLKKFDIAKGDFIIFKTINSLTEDFDYEHVYLEKSGAMYLANLEIDGVGTDALGIERAQPEHETHIALLSKNIVILEGLRLKEVEAGEYKLYALPLKIHGIDALPVRAILVSED